MARKTWTWLSGRKRPPGDYEELSTGVQWYDEPVSRTALGSWAEDSTVIKADWAADTFRDPSGMYYRNYITTQDVVERQLDAVIATARDADFISAVDPAWKDALTTFVGAMSFAEWSVAMAMQHVQRFALSATIAQAAQLQVMDKLRAAERDLEYFELLVPDPPANMLHDVWTESAPMQPLRRFLEEILVVQDWAQVVVGANVALMGILQPFLRELYVRGGRAHGDFVTAAMGTSFAKDAKRHVQWTDAFVRYCSAEEANTTTISEWLDTYVPPAVAAVDALVAAFPLGGVTAEAAGVARAELRTRLEELDVKRTENVANALEGDSDKPAA